METFDGGMDDFNIKEETLSDPEDDSNDHFNDEDQDDPLELQNKPADLFACDYCGKNYKSPYVLKYHIEKVHLVPSPTKPLNIDQSDSHNSHKQSDSHNSHKKFQCLLCKQRLSSQQTLDKHMLKHQERTTVKCKCCNTKFFNEEEYRKHEESVHTFECHVCALRFPKKWFLTYHLKYFHSEQFPFICLACGKWSKSKEEFEFHSEKHEYERQDGRRVYTCMLCMKPQAKIRQHVLSAHIGDLESGTTKRLRAQLSYTCTECNKSFPRYRELKDHIQETGHKRAKKQDYRCSVCEKVLESKGLLIQHKAAEHPQEATGEEADLSDDRSKGDDDDSWLHCDECSSRFKSLKKLEAHKHQHLSARHNEERFFKRLKHLDYASYLNYMSVSGEKPAKRARVESDGIKREGSL